MLFYSPCFFSSMEQQSHNASSSCYFHPMPHSFSTVLQYVIQMSSIAPLFLQVQLALVQRHSVFRLPLSQSLFIVSNAGALQLLVTNTAKHHYASSHPQKGNETTQFLSTSFVQAQTESKMSGWAMQMRFLSQWSICPLTSLSVSFFWQCSQIVYISKEPAEFTL